MPGHSSRRGTGLMTRAAARRGWWDDRRVLAAARRYVRTGVRSTAEVLRYLQRHGLPPAAAARVVSGYQACGLLDDRACARLWAEHWARRGYAWAAIQPRLVTKGLPDEATAASAGRLDTPQEDMVRARRLVAQRRYQSAGGRGRARLARTLSARGFDADLIEQLLEESCSPPSDAE